jgi:hypothetical protein
MYTFQALQILIFLIPGFISAAILNILVVRKGKNEIGLVIEALIFSLIVYTVYSLVITKSLITLTVVGESNGQSSTYSYDGIAFLWLLLFSIAIPLVLGFLIVNDWHMKLFRFLKTTKRTARGSVWFDVFYDRKRHVVIDLSNGRRIYGWPMYYSDDPDSPYIYLHKPSWIVEDKQTGKSDYINITTEGILLTPEQKIESITFLEE